MQNIHPTAASDYNIKIVSGRSTETKLMILRHHIVNPYAEQQHTLPSRNNNNRCRQKVFTVQESTARIHPTTTSATTTLIESNSKETK
jgi:hypothetical protein